MIFDTIIIGAGAAGLMSAMRASQRGKTVLILEHNAKPGLKILISGGGRCNFTNLNISPNDYVSQNPHFCKSALSQFTQNDFIGLVKNAGIAHYEKTLGQLFCKSSSKDILNLLLNQLDPALVTLKTSIHVTRVEKNQTHFVVSIGRENVLARNLVLATGGLSFSKLGASDLGYTIARQFGHIVTNLTPALDGFVFAGAQRADFQDLSGVSIEATLVTGKKSFQENILFTHAGLSGPAALKASLYWSSRQPVSLDFLPQVSDFEKWIQNLRHTDNKKLVINALGGFFVDRLTERFVKICRLENKRVADLSKADLELLKRTLKQYTFVPASTVGYDKAEVTRGGVDTHDISSKTMESKLVPGLYFVGEVLDVTGLLGGYNFQWAWSSGWVAGNSTV